MKSGSAPSTPAKVPLTEEQSLVLGIINAKIRGSKCYADAGNYQKRLQAKIGAGTEVALPDGRRYSLVDTFAGKDKITKLAFVDRYSLEQVEG